jgi:hypothetical protein
MLVLAMALAAAHGQVAKSLPNPVLTLISTEPFERDGKHFIRYKFDVANKDAYPAEMFAPAPELPPCGKNTQASRTWVDFYALGGVHMDPQTGEFKNLEGKRLNGFCALAKPSDLNGIWFAIEEGALPPSWVYIEMTDRKTNTKYKSNLAETSL